MKRFFAVLAVILATSSFAKAGMMIEPYLGYEMSDLKYKYISGPEYSDRMTGAGFGLRLGYKMLLPWVALDYTAGSGTAAADMPGAKDYDFTRSSLGAVVGVDLPLVRGWIGYGFSNELTAKGTSGAADYKYKGSYTKFGVGLGFIPFVSLNAEYKINDYKKVDLGNGERDKSDNFDMLKNDSVMVSISIPFNL